MTANDIRLQFRQPKLAMPGNIIRKMMRSNGVTIRELAQRTGISQVRIRQVLKTGLVHPMAAIDWEQAITGQYTARMRAIVMQWQNRHAS